MTVWDTALNKLDSWMVPRHTNPDLQQASIEHLCEWQDTHKSSNLPWNCSFKQALQFQNTIGWCTLLKGRVFHGKMSSKRIAKSLDLNNTGRQWVKQLILQLFNITCNMWEHRNGIKRNIKSPAKLCKI
jgi:hypothetical protein